MQPDETVINFRIRWYTYVFSAENQLLSRHCCDLRKSSKSGTEDFVRVVSVGSINDPPRSVSGENQPNSRFSRVLECFRREAIREHRFLSPREEILCSNSEQKKKIKIKRVHGLRRRIGRTEHSFVLLTCVVRRRKINARQTHRYFKITFPRPFVDRHFDFSEYVWKRRLILP